MPQAKLIGNIFLLFLLFLTPAFRLFVDTEEEILKKIGVKGKVRKPPNRRYSKVRRGSSQAIKYPERSPFFH